MTLTPEEVAMMTDYDCDPVKRGTGELDMSAPLRRSTRKRWAIWREGDELKAVSLPLGAEPMDSNTIVVVLESELDK